MVNVILLPNRGDEVMAPLFYGLHYLKTRPQHIEVTGPFRFCDPEITLDFDDSLSGVRVRAIFNNQSCGLFVMPGCVAVYLGDLIEALDQAGQTEVSDRLKGIKASELSLVILDEKNYKIL